MNIEYDILQDKIGLGNMVEQLSDTKKLCGVILKTQNDMQRFQSKYMATLSVEDANIYRSIKERNRRMKALLKLRIEALHEAIYKDTTWGK